MPVPLCEICGEFPAKYVCQSCGSRVCEFDIDPSTGYCKRCLQRRETVAFPSEKVSWTGGTGFKVFALGMILILIGFALMFSSMLIGPFKGNLTGGGGIFIFPFPFIFYSGTGDLWVTAFLWLAIIIFIVFIFFELLFFRSVFRK